MARGFGRVGALNIGRPQFKSCSLVFFAGAGGGEAVFWRLVFLYADMFGLVLEVGLGQSTKSMRRE